MFKKKSILCVLLAIIFTVATSCTNQSNQDNVVKTKEEWITEFSKDICKTCFPYQLGDEKDYYYIYELLIQEDGLVQGNAIIGDLKYNYVFKQIVISGDFYFYLFSVYLLVEENPKKDKHYNPEKSKRSQLYIEGQQVSMGTFQSIYFITKDWGDLNNILQEKSI